MLKPFLEIFTPENQFLIFEKELRVSNMDYYILHILTRLKFIVHCTRKVMDISFREKNLINSKITLHCV